MLESINNQSMLKVGTILHGTYRIDSYLSSGGFGNTYVATNIEFDERVAIKEFFMKGVTQRDDNQTTVSVSNSENTNSFLGQKEKFKKEARRIRQLKNDHIVNVYDLFEENGTAYYVMDYVDGENLAERLKRTGKPMSEQEVRDILPQILDALKSIHDAGIWHLDLKPANILINKSGLVKLIDFGASKQMNAQKGGATTSTAISYTNGYAPREQMEQNYDKFGPWTDIYALGATLYNLLTNERPPLPTDIDDDITTDKHEALPFPGSVSSETKTMVLMMLNTNRMQRPQSVDGIINSEKSRKVTSQYAPKHETKTLKTASYEDEETIISAPIQKEKESESKLQTEPSCSTTLGHKGNAKPLKIIILGLVVVFCIVLPPFYVIKCSPLYFANRSPESISDLNDTIDSETIAQILKNRLDYLRQKGIMFGHQDDTVYGLSWEFDKNNSDIKSVCGDYPAIMGFDLGGIEVGNSENLDGVPFVRITEEVKSHNRRGGIITLSWHSRNPVTNIEVGDKAVQDFPKGTSWDVTDESVVRKILDGGEYHEKFEVWMQRLSNFLATLTDDEGQKIPIIFRPWHENSGSWFWWGENFCTKDEYIALWNMLQDKLKADGFDNILWSYSPGMQDNLTAERLLERYPGDDRVDLLGLDGYQWSPEEKVVFTERCKQNLTVLCEVAKNHGLIPALSECGLKNVSDPIWWTSILFPIIKSYPISYIFTWRNYKYEWYGPSPITEDKQDFLKFYKEEKMLFLEDIQ